MIHNKLLLFLLAPRACTILNNSSFSSSSRQRVGPISFGIAPCACMSPNRLLLLLLHSKSFSFRFG